MCMRKRVHAGAAKGRGRGRSQARRRAGRRANHDEEVLRPELLRGGEASAQDKRLHPPVDEAAHDIPARVRKGERGLWCRECVRRRSWRSARAKKKAPYAHTCA